MIPEQVGKSPVKLLSEPLYKVKGWMKFIGVISIIGGALQVLSIWGILIAWLPIWMGVLIFSSAQAIEKAYATEQEQEMKTALSKLGTYFMVTGIMLIVGTVVVAVGVFLGIVIPKFLGTCNIPVD